MPKNIGYGPEALDAYAAKRKAAGKGVPPAMKKKIMGKKGKKKGKKVVPPKRQVPMIDGPYAGLA